MELPPFEPYIMYRKLLSVIWSILNIEKEISFEVLRKRVATSLQREVDKVELIEALSMMISYKQVSLEKELVKVI
jgi:hypothetical protein